MRGVPVRWTIALVLTGALVALLGASWGDLDTDHRVSVLAAVGAFLAILVGADLLQRLWRHGTEDDDER